MKRILLLGLTLTQLHGMELINSHGISSKDEALKLYHNNHDMYVEDDNAAYRIEQYQMNKELRDVLKYKALAKFIESEGYIRINEDDGKYSLVAKVRGDGGGPVTANALYWVTKTFCYGTLLGAATAGAATIVGASGGTAAIPMATAMAAGKTAIVSGAMGIGATAVATTVSTTAAGAVVGTAAAGTAGTIVAAGGGSWGIIAAVETASCAAGAFGLWLPLP